MHMADALLSPAVGGTMWAASAGIIAYCSKKVRQELDDKKVPLMGVMGAFLFSAQMINFSIPVTGTSGHLGGGMLLTILLGPYAAFLTIASVLVVQALFFADGGLLALGCNIFNMGFWPAFVVYPFIYKKIVGTNPRQSRLALAAMISAIIGLQLGPFSVVLETVCSGISALPFSTFVLLMQPIHLAIGVVEGVVTVAVISFVHQARPEILRGVLEARSIGTHSVRNVVMTFMIAALLTGGIVSWFASKNPDGLEWAITKVTGKEELEGSKQGLHGALASIQEATAFLPDYAFKKPAEPQREAAQPEGENKKDERGKLGTSTAGVVGGLLTLAITFLTGFVLRRRVQPVSNC
ncbi:MAG: energy-coupling factor ABC transporter permease [Desulfuromonadales bacterium]|nr:energy-coupling factor ABC transporter permease [Desulfuromonadales bacterium]